MKIGNRSSRSENVAMVISLNRKSFLTVAALLSAVWSSNCQPSRTASAATAHANSAERATPHGYQDDKEHGQKVSVIYCADLFHPHNDPDDHFDIAALYSLPEIEVRAIILDQNNHCGWDQETTPGSVPITQLNYITKRDVPYAIGLRFNLVTPEDKGLWGEQDQKGIELLIDALRQSSRPVTVITVGSLRDLAAAYNRNPALLRKKIDRVFVFAGEASKTGFVDYNVDLDINAYIRVMGSDLPVYWVPCFDGGMWKNNGNASWWDASHKDLLSKASKKALNFFIYALLKKDTKTVDPISYIDGAIDTKGRDKVFAMTRHLWSSSVFTYVANRKIIQKDGVIVSVPGTTKCRPEQLVDLFNFKDVAIDVDRPARPARGLRTDETRKVKLFHITGKDIYAKAMTSIAAELYSHLGEVNP